MFADLDEFKLVNDTHGHDVGDELLIAVAERLTQVLRSGDTLARLSGDEFVVLCEELDDVWSVESLAHRIDEAFNESFVLSTMEIQISASVGIAYAGRDTATSEQILKVADKAMYKAKRRRGASHNVVDLRGLPLTAGVELIPNQPEQAALAQQALTAATFLAIIDTLVVNFDVIEVLTLLTGGCVELLGAAAAGVLLEDGSDHLVVVGASTDQVKALELSSQGPFLDSYCTGLVVVHANLHEPSPWPEFAAASLAVGFASMCAIPLQFNPDRLGCLGLFMTDPLPLSDTDVAIATALADVAAIAILQHQAIQTGRAREGQLQHALNHRVVIEQAKGMIAERSGLDMDFAFQRIRQFARNGNLKLSDVADSVVARSMETEIIGRLQRRPPPPPRERPPR